MGGNLQNRCFVCPCWCPFCKNVKESVDHIFLQYHISSQVWTLVCEMMDVRYLWHGESLGRLGSLGGTRLSPKTMKAPPIISGGLWLGRNNIIFQDKSSCCDRLIGQIIAIYDLILDDPIINISLQFHEE